jgi:hypothetical protein
MSIIANVSGCTNIKNIICNDADDVQTWKGGRFNNDKSAIDLRIEK